MATCRACSSGKALTITKAGQHSVRLDVRGRVPKDGNMRSDELVPRQVAFAPHVELEERRRGLARGIQHLAAAATNNKQETTFLSCPPAQQSNLSN